MDRRARTSNRLSFTWEFRSRPSAAIIISGRFRRSGAGSFRQDAASSAGGCVQPHESSEPDQFCGSIFRNRCGRFPQLRRAIADGVLTRRKTRAKARDYIGNHLSKNVVAGFSPRSSVLEEILQRELHDARAVGNPQLTEQQIGPVVADSLQPVG